MSNVTASGYGGFGSQLTVVDKVIPKINMEYYCKSNLSKMANWDADPQGDLRCGGAVHYETSLGLEADEVCGDENGNVSLLTQSFASDKLILCGQEIFTYKRDKLTASRMCSRLNELDNVLFPELEQRMIQITEPFAMHKLLASAHPEGMGLSAIGIPNTGGSVASGLGDANNPIKVDVSSSRSGGNMLQPGTIDMPTLCDRLMQNMFEKGVTCTTDSLMISGGGKLASGFSKDKMCLDTCKLNTTMMNYTVTHWMPSIINANGDKIDYIVMHDPKDFWFQMHTLYMNWVEFTHNYELGGAFLFGSKVNRPKSVSVAAVQFV
jgi:hypothetical protein